MNSPALQKRAESNGQLPPAARRTKIRKRPFGTLTSAELDKKKWLVKWLAEGIFVHRQAAVIGGPLKSLKTSLSIDLAVSLGAGKPFLGKFRVPQKRRVAVFSGETVRGSLLASARRIAASKQVKFSSCDVLWSFRLPQLSVETDREQLTELIRSEKIEVVIIDPFYLSLGSGMAGRSVTNLFETGPLLQEFAAGCLEAGATPIFVHHTSKTSGQRRSKDDDAVRGHLNDLAYAGLGEFARQWLLISRNTEFNSANGRSDLGITVGGSAGQSGHWRVLVDEGRMKNDFSGRVWRVSFPAITAGSNEEDE